MAAKKAKLSPRHMWEVLINEASTGNLVPLTYEYVDDTDLGFGRITISFKLLDTKVHQRMINGMTDNKKPKRELRLEDFL